jgi:hypothetical protein
MSLLSTAGTILLYFAAGCLNDFLVAKYFLFLSTRKRGPASLLSFGIDIFGYAIAATLILDRNILGAISFAFGTSLGTWVAMGKKKQAPPR